MGVDKHQRLFPEGTFQGFESLQRALQTAATSCSVHSESFVSPQAKQDKLQDRDDKSSSGVDKRAHLSTTASRNKTRPQPKFQRVMTSGILSRMRQDSHRIAKDPTRFLEGMINGKYGSHQVNTEVFTTFLTEETGRNSADGYRSSLETLEKRCLTSKNRTLLLSLGSNPVIQKSKSRSSGADKCSTSSISSFLAGGNEQEVDVSSLMRDCGEDEVDILLHTFLDEIRVANVDQIEVWVKTRASVSDMELPFGLPSSGLKMPVSGMEKVAKWCREFICSTNEQFLLLDGEYHAKLEGIFEQITSNFRQIVDSNWAEKDSALLFHIMSFTQVNKGVHHFSKEKLATEVATRLFPLYSREEVIAQKYLLKMKRAFEEKRNAVIGDWKSAKRFLMEQVNYAWDDIQRKVTLKAKLEVERKAQQEKCGYWLAKLEEMRRTNAVKLRAVEILVKPLEEEREAHDNLLRRQENLRRLEQKVLVDKFKEHRILSQQEFEKQQAEVAAKEAERKRVEAFHNQRRVLHRHQKRLEKVEAAQEEAKRKEDERLQRIEALERTKEPVNLQFDPLSILQDTHASLVRSHEVELDLLRRSHEPEDAGVVQFFRERYSFSADTLWKDARVRLEAKLREAGLIDNSYARHVLLAMQPKAKPHLRSQICFNNDDET